MGRGTALDPRPRSKLQIGLLLAAGVVLAGVPTAYTVLPEWTGSHGTETRTRLLAAWAVVLVITVWFSLVRDDRLDRVTKTAATASSRQRYVAFSDAMTALCMNPAGFTPEHEVTVYLATTDGKWLHPLWPKIPLAAGELDFRSFETGKGATGHAYANQETFWALGDDVSNDRYELREDQVEPFSDYQTVASAPITNLDGDGAVGVVTILHREKQTELFGTPEGAGHKALLSLADTLGVVIGRLIEPEDLWIGNQSSS